MIFMINDFFQEKKYKIIPNENGNIYKFADSDVFPEFIRGDIYFSEINLFSSKPWRRHTKLKCVIGVVYGETIIKLKSKINGECTIKRLSIEGQNLILINPSVWYSFENHKDKNSLLFVMLNGKHKDNEVERLL